MPLKIARHGGGRNRLAGIFRRGVQGSYRPGSQYSPEVRQKLEKVIKEDSVLPEKTSPQTMRRRVDNLNVTSGATLKASDLKFLRVVEGKESSKAKASDFIVKSDPGILSKFTSDILRSLSGKKYAVRREVLFVDEDDNIRTAIKVDDNINGHFFLGEENNIGSYVIGTRAHFSSKAEEELDDMRFMRSYARMCGVLYVLGEFDDNPQNFLRSSKSGRPVKIDMGGPALDARSHPELKNYDVRSRSHLFRFFGCEQSRTFLGKYIANDPRFSETYSSGIKKDGIKDCDVSEVMVRAVRDFPDPRMSETDPLPVCREDIVSGYCKAGKDHLVSNMDDETLRLIKKRIDQEKENGEFRTRDLFIEFMSGISDMIMLAIDESFFREYIKNIEEDLNKFSGLSAKKNELLKEIEILRDFLIENSADAQRLFQPYLDYYNEIKSELSPFPENRYDKEEKEEKREKGRLKKATRLMQDEIDEFESGKTVTLTPEFLQLSKIQLRESVRQDKKYLYRNHDKTKDKEKPLGQYFEQAIQKGIPTRATREPTAIYLSKAPKMDETVLVLDDSVSLSVNTIFEDDIGLFETRIEQEEESTVIDLCFGDGLNFGGKIFGAETGKTENITRNSDILEALAFLHQRKEEDRSKFLDFVTSDDLKNKTQVKSGRPILINNLTCAAPLGERDQLEDIKVNGLFMSFCDISKDSSKDKKDFTKHVFLTFYNGLKLCKDKNPNKFIEVRSGLDDYKKSGINPFLLLALQIYSAEIADIEMTLSNGIDEEEQEIILYFKQRILPKLNKIMSFTHHNHGEKIDKIHDLCFEAQLYFNRIKHGLVGRKYEDLEKSIIDSLTDEQSRIKLNRDNIAKTSMMLKNKGLEAFKEDNPSRQEFLDKLKDLSVISSEVSNSEELTQNLTRISSKRKIVDLVEVQNDDDGHKRSEIFARLDTNKHRKPNSKLTPTQTVSLISFSRFSQERREIEYYQRIIDRTIEDVSNMYSDPDFTKQIITAMMNAMAQYGREHLLGVGGKESDLIVKGGKNAGFSKWKNELEFRMILQQYLSEEGINDVDLSPEGEMIKFMATLSSDLQEESKEKQFRATDKKFYIDRKGNREVKMTRSWRMAMIRAGNNYSEHQEGMVR